MDEGKFNFFLSSYLTIISVMRQLLFVSDNSLILAYRGTSITCESPVGSTTFPIIYLSFMSSNSGLFSSRGGTSYTLSQSMSHLVVHILWFR